MVDSLRSVATVYAAGIAYKYCLFLDNVSSLSMGGARIDGVLVI